MATGVVRVVHHRLCPPDLPPTFHQHLLHSTFHISHNPAPCTLGLPLSFHRPPPGPFLPLLPLLPLLAPLPLCLDSQTSGFLIQLSSLEGGDPVHPAAGGPCLPDCLSRPRATMHLPYGAVCPLSATAPYSHPTCRPGDTDSAAEISVRDRVLEGGLGVAAYCAPSSLLNMEHSVHIPSEFHLRSAQAGGQVPCNLRGA